jgi:aspartate carbamoyltransferase regulatory subunit
MTERPEYKVTALRQGTVIDHLPPGTALQALKVLGDQGGNTVTVGMNLTSGKMGKKDLIKIENKELTEQEFAKIALLAPRSRISIIRDYKVVEKADVGIPEEFVDVLKCPNPACITNHERVTTCFRVESEDPLKIRCRFCESELGQDELEII